MEGNLPWALVFTGVFIAVVVEVVGIPVLPFAIGVYLPVHLNACIMVGGLVRLVLDRIKGDKDKKRRVVNDGILFCSGMIAGEGLVGILLAVLAVLGVDKVLDISGLLGFSTPVANIASIVVFALVILSVLKFSIWKKSSK
jgi:uncharacterized oligopeptide transporter (OPT) family protein